LYFVNKLDVLQPLQMLSVTHARQTAQCYGHQYHTKQIDAIW